ncbi:hypothetical protein D3C86_2219830 [compost metagenome]
MILITVPAPPDVVGTITGVTVEAVRNTIACGVRTTVFPGGKALTIKSAVLPESMVLRMIP